MERNRARLHTSGDNAVNVNWHTPPLDRVLESVQLGLAFRRGTNQLFSCSKDNIIKLTGDYGSGTTLESVGKSIDDLE